AVRLARDRPQILRLRLRGRSGDADRLLGGLADRLRLGELLRGGHQELGEAAPRPPAAEPGPGRETPRAFFVNASRLAGVSPSKRGNVLMSLMSSCRGLAGNWSGVTAASGPVSLARFEGSGCVPRFDSGPRTSWSAKAPPFV